MSDEEHQFESKVDARVQRCILNKVVLFVKAVILLSKVVLARFFPSGAGLMERGVISA